jgi:protein-tyrosine phosphatase
MNPELYWISGPWRGRLAVLTRPRGGDWIDDEIGGWKRAGLHMVVSLLETQEAAELELSREDDAARAEGVEFLSFPIPDRGVPVSMPPARSLLRNITDALDRGQNVGVHCRQGIGRSGMVAAGVLLVSGMGVEQAIRTVSESRGQTVPETPGQHEWLRQLSTQLPVTAS